MLGIDQEVQPSPFHIDFTIDLCCIPLVSTLWMCNEAQQATDFWLSSHSGYVSSKEFEFGVDISSSFVVGVIQFKMTTNTKSSAKPCFIFHPLPRPPTRHLPHPRTYSTMKITHPPIHLIIYPPIHPFNWSYTCPLSIRPFSTNSFTNSNKNFCL